MGTLYTELLRFLSKASKKKLPKAFRQRLEAAHDKTEEAVKAYLLQEVGSYHSRLHHIIGTRLAKADSLKQQVTQAVEDALGPTFADALPEMFDELVKELVDNFQETLGVNVSFNQVNAAVTKAMREQTANYFSTFSDNEAEGIYSAIATAMKSDSGYSVASIALQILKSPVVYGAELPMQPAAWAQVVARTEVARATTTAQKASLDDLGLSTWQWQAEASACDDCAFNDDEIVTIGDAFPSGDDEPPAHPNCRCVCLPVMDELLSQGDYDPDNDET